MTLPPWRSLLAGARKREGNVPTARWLQLATVASDGTPRVRTLVFRGWGAESDQLDFCTDGRSAKLSDLLDQPAVELCWLFPKVRQQYRFRGITNILSIAEAANICGTRWMQLTPSGRALWGWPSPGQTFQPDADFPMELADNIKLPKHFMVLRVTTTQVELLDLKNHPHKRILWQTQ